MTRTEIWAYGAFRSQNEQETVARVKRVSCSCQLSPDLPSEFTIDICPFARPDSGCQITNICLKPSRSGNQVLKGRFGFEAVYDAPDL